ncbi:MAG: DUF5615 family PIN-like protein [Candidatus Brocadiales bacterium]
MARFLLDENLPISSVDVFRRYGLDANHVRVRGLIGLSDQELLKIARHERRILITRDMGFANLLDYPFGSHHGIIVLRLPDTYTVRQVDKVIENFLVCTRPSEIENALVIVEPGKYRIRKE